MARSIIRPIALAGVVGSGSMSAACVSDRDAPDCYNPETTDLVQRCEITGADARSDGEGGRPEIDCSDIPDGALRGEYAYTPMAQGGTTPYTWSAEGLPDGLSIDGRTGELGGVPEETGEQTLELELVDARGTRATASCRFEVFESLEADLDTLFAEPPGCLSGEQTLLDVLADGTGDGSPVQCDLPRGIGTGRRPDGVEIDPDTCEVTVDLEGLRYGTWVFLVRGVQSGAEVFVPYCVPQTTPAEDAYTIEVSRSDLDGDPEALALVPLVGSYDPQADTFTFGDVDDPEFRVLGPDDCGASTCFFGFSYAVNGSGFDADTFALERPDDRAALVQDGGRPVGFSHGIFVRGPNPDLGQDRLDELARRPWVLNATLHYCLSDASGDCDDDVADGNIETNGNGELELGIIMLAR